MRKSLVLLTALACITGTAYAKEIKNSNLAVIEPKEEPVAEGLIVGTGAEIAEIPASELGGRKFFYKAETFHEMAALPGFSIAAPSGLVPSYGVIFGGFSGQTRKKLTSDNTDAAMGIGAGFGNANRSLGGAVSLSLGSISGRGGGAFDRGALNIVTGHNFQKYGLGVAVGAAGIDLWHKSNEDESDPSFYGVVTKLLPNDTAPVVISAGLGNNGYADVSKKEDRKDKIGGFASAAVYVLPQVSLIADYTSGMLSLGTGIVPFPKYPVSLTLGAKDITEEENKKVAFIGSISAAYVF